MMDALEPLAELPGVELVMLVTHDGVPIAVPGKNTHSGEPGDPEGDFQDGDGACALGREDALAALATGWLDELRSTVAPLSWDGPTRVVLKAARGSLVMQRTKSAVLVLVLGRGQGSEEVRLAMEGTIGRIERGLRGMGGLSSPAAAQVSPLESNGEPTGEPTSEPTGPMPSPQTLSLRDDATRVADQGHGHQSFE